MPRISIFGVGRAKFRKTDSKVSMGLAAGQLQQTQPGFPQREVEFCVFGLLLFY